MNIPQIWSFTREENKNLGVLPEFLQQNLAEGQADVPADHELWNQNHELWNQN